MENSKIVLITLACIVCVGIAGTGAASMSTHHSDDSCSYFQVDGFYHHGVTNLEVSDSSGEPVEDARVYIDGNFVGTTNERGAISYIPQNFDVVSVIIAGDERASYTHIEHDWFEVKQVCSVSTIQAS